MEEPPKKYFRLFPGNEVRLKSAYVIKCTGCDKDENGNPKSATMKVRYAVPKKNFNRNLKRLYIRLFEQNLPINEEEGGAMGGATSADSSGQFSQPLFSKPVKQKPYTEVMDEASTTQTGGDFVKA